MASAGHLSPSTRLPSPPPMAEDQTGPQSPIPADGDRDTLLTSAASDSMASRRVRPGTRSAEIKDGPPLVELSEIDSPFQLTEHLKALHHHHTHTHPPLSPRSVPLTRQTAAILASCPSGVDRSLWLYELCRFLVLRVNIFVNGLFSDSPPCSAITCHEMRASEWQYLCAVHDPPKSCCAIDYCCHTLDWAASVLTSPRHFPSRLSLDGVRETSVASNPAGSGQMRQLTNVFRRVYRIFAHTWFQHRDVFWRVEGRTGLYCLFKTVCDAYQLIPEDNYTIPSEAEGLDDHSQDGHKRVGSRTRIAPSDAARPTSILRRDEHSPPTETNVLGTGATARRHKHTPSKGAPVGTVLEEAEEEDSLHTRADNGTLASPSNLPLTDATTIVVTETAEDDGDDFLNDNPSRSTAEPVADTALVNVLPSESSKSEPEDHERNQEDTSTTLTSSVPIQRSAARETLQDGEGTSVADAADSTLAGKSVGD